MSGEKEKLEVISNNREGIIALTYALVIEKNISDMLDENPLLFDDEVFERISRNCNFSDFVHNLLCIYIPKEKRWSEDNVKGYSDDWLHNIVHEYSTSDGEDIGRYVKDILDGAIEVKGYWCKAQ